MSVAVKITSLPELGTPERVSCIYPNGDNLSARRLATWRGICPVYEAVKLHDQRLDIRALFSRVHSSGRSKFNNRLDPNICPDFNINEQLDTA